MSETAAVAPVDLEALWAKVRKSSFYAAMKSMPPAERDAMFAIYAFCRAVDDIADDQLGHKVERTAALKPGGRMSRASFMAAIPDRPRSWPSRSAPSAWNRPTSSP